MSTLSEGKDSKTTLRVLKRLLETYEEHTGEKVIKIFKKSRDYGAKGSINTKGRKSR